MRWYITRDLTDPDRVWVYNKEPDRDEDSSFWPADASEVVLSSLKIAEAESYGLPIPEPGHMLTVEPSFKALTCTSPAETNRAGTDRPAAAGKLF